MNFDFSIEASSEKIQNINTKEYFKEVYQTFVNGNYRSATVMLYSVLICDLIFKLKDLRDIYNDSKAKKILEEVEKLQLESPRLAEWETKLIDMIKDRTSLLESSDIIAIESLQKFRHLSAHPVLTNADLLFSPNKETIQSLIRNILEGVLTNPPFFSNKIFDGLLMDLASVKSKLTDYEDIKKYLYSRYLKQLKENDFKKLFRSLWKVVFTSEDALSEENLVVNKRALRVLINHDKASCIAMIQSEPSYYSNIKENSRLITVSSFLARFPEIYHVLDASLQLLINKVINESEDGKLIGWYLKPSLKEHLLSLNPNDFTLISGSSLNYIKELCLANNCINELIDFSIEYFGLSTQWANAEQRYTSIILNIAPHLNINQANELLRISNENYQIYYAWHVRPKMQEMILELFGDQIDKALYPNIFK